MDTSGLFEAQLVRAGQQRGAVDIEWSGGRRKKAQGIHMCAMDAASFDGVVNDVARHAQGQGGLVDGTGWGRGAGWLVQHGPFV